MAKSKTVEIEAHHHHMDGHAAATNRGMNIACGVVIAIVVVAMIVATIVYFCMNKGSGCGNGNGGYVGMDTTAQQQYQQQMQQQMQPPQMPQMPSPPVSQVNASKQQQQPGSQADLVPPANTTTSARFGQVPQEQAPADMQGPIFPRLSAEDERELAKTHQLDAVKNYAKGQKEAILNDMKYTMIHDRPPIFRQGDFFPYRGKEDELMFQVQTEQALKYNTEFNQTDDYWMLKEQGLRPELT